MTTRSETIARHLGGVLVGIAVAVVFAAAMGWLWPEMRLPTFFIALIWWGLGGVNVIIRESRNPDLAEMPGTVHMKFHKEPRRGGGEGYQMSDLDYMVGRISTFFLGTFIALLTAGLIGKLWPPSRWPLFLVLLMLWMAVGIIAITAENRRR